jgi:prepilin signal peptidase PulO-like enzyme (type II secretory pathway)
MSTTIFPIFGFILGIILGSFSKALADRSLSGKSFWGRSNCLSCKHLLSWYDLFPLLSYLSLKGKCRYCHKKIGFDNLSVELILGLVVAFIFWQSAFVFPGIEDSLKLIQFSIELLFKVFFVTVLTIVTITDIRKTLIPDRVIKPAILIALILLLIGTIYKVWFLYYFLSHNPLGQLLLPPHNEYFMRHVVMIVEPFIGSILTGLAIGGFFISLIIITKGKGMGGGDVNLGAFLGLALGFPLGVLALMLSFVTGAIFSIVLIILRKKKIGSSIPFGPFLVLGSLVALFWGNTLLDWYLHLGR